MKKVAVIQDLSSFGKCSLTAAIPVLSVMGVQACPLPTAILTAQTGYPSFYCEDFTSKMNYFTEEWSKLHVTFDGITTDRRARRLDARHAWPPFGSSRPDFVARKDVPHLPESLCIGIRM